MNAWLLPDRAGAESSPLLPQMETSGVLDKVTQLKGELPTWATSILRNVSWTWHRGWGQPHSQRWTELLMHMELLLSPVPSPWLPGKPAQPVLLVLGMGGGGGWLLGPLPAVGSSLSCRKVSVS